MMVNRNELKRKRKQLKREKKQLQRELRVAERKMRAIEYKKESVIANYTRDAAQLIIKGSDGQHRLESLELGEKAK